jgi:hypothetical protein
VVVVVVAAVTAAKPLMAAVAAVVAVRVELLALVVDWAPLVVVRSPSTPTTRR